MGANNSRLSPRQKMINLMYIVLTAMLALNVSSDVLDGFVQVQHSLERSNENVARRNEAIYSQLERLAEQNPDKAQELYERASVVHDQTLGLLQYVDSLTLAIVKEADGPQGDLKNIKNRDNLEAAAVVMLSPGSQNGKNLRLKVDRFRDQMTSQMFDASKKELIMEALSTADITRGDGATMIWEEAKFDQQPVVAAVTQLTKLKNDILYAEGEVLGSLLSQVGADDVHVNELNAFVIPNSRMIMRGGQYEASIVLAAVDTTMRPEVYINGNRLGGDGTYKVPAGKSGTFSYDGYINVPRPDGTTSRHPFHSSYTVIEPMATVSATMMNVLFSGADNPISISVPGVSMNDISATMTNGTLTRKGDIWIARTSAAGKEAKISVTAKIDGRTTQVASADFRVIAPMASVTPTMMNVLYAGIDNPISISVPGVADSDISATISNGTLTRRGDQWIAKPTGVGKDAVLTVTARIGGQPTTVAAASFRIRKLPDPTAFIAYTNAEGQTAEYKGGKPFSKRFLMDAPGLKAAIDDGLIDTKFTVTSFQTVFFDRDGNAMLENSEGDKFSGRQKERFRNLSRGKRFFITNIKAIGPDGISRDLSPMEVIVG